MKCRSQEQLLTCNHTLITLIKEKLKRKTSLLLLRQIHAHGMRGLSEKGKRRSAVTEKTCSTSVITASKRRAFHRKTVKRQRNSLAWKVKETWHKEAIGITHGKHNGNTQTIDELQHRLIKIDCNQAGKTNSSTKIPKAPGPVEPNNRTERQKTTQKTNLGESWRFFRTVAR